MLYIKDLHVSYGTVPALQGVDLEVNEGEIVTVIGANGAGKSTLLMTISGVLKPVTGEIRLRDRRIDTEEPKNIVRMGISQVPEGRLIFPDLTVTENLVIGAYTRDDSREVAEDRAWVEELFPILSERSEQMAGTLSGGEQQMLAIARGLMARPSLLLLDEPSMGLAPIIIETIFTTLNEINKHGTTILLVEQNAYRALEVAHRGYVLEGGQVLACDTCEKLRHDPMIRKAYLGEEIKLMDA